MQEELGCTPLHAIALSPVDAAPAGGPPFLVLPYVVRAWRGAVPTATCDEGVPLAWIPIADAMRAPHPAIPLVLDAARAALDAPPGAVPT